MASMPGIVVKVAADTRDAIAGLGRVDRALGKTATRSAKAARALKIGFAAAGTAAVAAGAVFVKVAGDAIDAAIEEEQSVARLAKTMENLGLASKKAGVEEFIDNLQFSANVADNQLRPAFDRLVRSTQDVGEAQKATVIALDIAAAKDKDVADVANILGKAYDGNTMALGRLGVGLDKAILQSGDMAKITEELTRLFGGQANAQADTLGGSIKGVQIAYDELIESFGQGLVGASGEDIVALQKAEQTLRDMQPAAEDAGEDIRDIGFAALTTYDRIKFFSDLVDQNNWGGAWQAFILGAQGADQELIDLINSTRTLNSDLVGTQTAALDAASALHSMNAARDFSVGDPLGQGTTMDAGYVAQIAAANVRHRRALQRARAAKAAEEAAAAAAKAKADAARKAAAAKAKATRAASAQDAADELMGPAYVPFSPPRWNRNRKIALRRADGRAAQRDARTGSRP